MDAEPTSPSGPPLISREKTAPFLIRTFVKIGSFHRLTLFEDSTLPTTDEQQLFTWKDATLREVLTTLRNTAPHIPEYKHPLARFSFRTVYADSLSKGRFSQKDLGMVYSRDILGEPGVLGTVAPRLREDVDLNEEGGDAQAHVQTEREREERTLDELRFVPGDFLLVAVLLPKSVTAPAELAIKGSGVGAVAGGGIGAGGAGAGGANGWRGGAPGGRGGGDSGWGGAPAGRGGGHWRGDSNAPGPGGRGRGGRGGEAFGREREFEKDRRVPPPRRSVSPPMRGRGWGERGRGGRGGRGGGGGGGGGRRSRSRSYSRSRSPPPHRRRRYD